MTTPLESHFFSPGPKRILSLDGGGVRGLITLGMLKQVEGLMKQRVAASGGDPDNYRLSDTFDLIGGTSTGGIMATLLALGETVDDITELYFHMCPRIFKRKNFFAGIQSKFDSRAFENEIYSTFHTLLEKYGHTGPEPRMDTPLLRTGLALMTKRIDTGSVWCLTNNPRAKYWDPASSHWKPYFDHHGGGDFFPNSQYILRKMVQASASAPFYLEGVEMDIAPQQKGLFLDGGASPFNNPSQELFLMVALKAEMQAGNGQGLQPYGFGWQTGADNLYMLSLGTGGYRDRLTPWQFDQKWAVGKAIHALSGIISDADKSAVTWMQALSETEKADHIDGNLMDMRGLRLVDEPLLTFKRFNPRLENDWLVNELGDEFKLTPGELKRTREMDWPAKANLERLHKIGLETGRKFIEESDLPGSG